MTSDAAAVDVVLGEVVEVDVDVDVVVLLVVGGDVVAGTLSVVAIAIGEVIDAVDGAVLASSELQAASDSNVTGANHHDRRIMRSISWG